MPHQIILCKCITVNSRYWRVSVLRFRNSAINGNISVYYIIGDFPWTVRAEKKKITVGPLTAKFSGECESKQMRRRLSHNALAVCLHTDSVDGSIQIRLLSLIFLFIVQIIAKCKSYSVLLLINILWKSLFLNDELGVWITYGSHWFIWGKWVPYWRSVWTRVRIRAFLVISYGKNMFQLCDFFIHGQIEKLINRQ